MRKIEKFRILLAAIIAFVHFVRVKFNIISMETEGLILRIIFAIMMIAFLIDEIRSKDRTRNSVIFYLILSIIAVLMVIY